MSYIDPPRERDELGTTRPWLLAGGWLLFALGIVGIALPVMPTTVFWIGAVWCWSRSAPRLTRRILSHPRFGQPVRLFVERGEMTRQSKRAAIGGIAIGYALLHLLARPDWPIGLLVAITLSLIGIWLWRRSEPAITQSPSPAASGADGLDPPTVDTAVGGDGAASRTD